MQFLINKTCSKEEALGLIHAPRDYISIDIETVSLTNLTILGISVGISRDTAFYFFDCHDELLKSLITNADTVIMHNAKFDLPQLRALGCIIPAYEDTKMIAYAAGIMDTSIEELSGSILHKEYPSVTSQWKKKDQGNIGINHVVMGQMSMAHACNTYALWEQLPKTTLYAELDKPVIELLMEMEHWGLLVDQYKLTQVEQEVVERIGALEHDLYAELGDINLASNVQVANALKLKGVIGTRKTKGGADSVSDEALKPLHHPVADKILKWRSEMKTVSTYIPNFRSPDAQGRIHTHYNYTRTGRFSSSNPNLQNLSRNERFQDLEE